tara:strand:- start:2577 stop:3008 length:432 start_codon:yes stop_codon:yes gene_type:complete
MNKAPNMNNYEVPFYEYSGPCSKNEHDLKFLIKDFKEYLEIRDTHLPYYSPNDEVYDLIIKYVVYNNFKDCNSSWRGYYTFKLDIHVDMYVKFLNMLIYMHKLKNIIKKYINNFKERYYAPPINGIAGGMGYYKLANRTLIGK